MFTLWVLKSAFVFLGASVVGLMLRRRSAALRHLVWVAAFVVVAGLPILQVALQPVSPSVRVEVPPPPVRLISNTSPAPGHLIGSDSPATSEPSGPVEASGYRLFVPDYEGLLGMGYILGLIALGRPLAISLARVRRAARHARPFDAGAFHRGIDVRVCAPEHTLQVPATFGWIHPVILLPSDAEGWDRRRLAAVLAHELAHIGRADWLWQTIALVVAAVQWFNPVAWWAVRQLRLEAEMAADDQVLSLGVAATTYAQELLTFGRGKADGVCAVPMARRSGLGRRISAVLSARQDRTVPGTVMRGRVIVGGALCALAVGALAIHEAQAVRPKIPTGNSLSTLYTGRSLAFWPDVNLTLTQVVSVSAEGSYRRWGADGRQPNHARRAFLLSQTPSAERLYEVQAEGAKFNLLPGEGYRIKTMAYRRTGSLNVYLIAVDSGATSVNLHVQSASPIGGNYEILEKSLLHVQPKGGRWVGYMENTKAGTYELEDVNGRVKTVRAQGGHTPLDLPAPIREGRREFRELKDAVLGPILLQSAAPVVTSSSGVWYRQTIAGLPLAIGWIEDTTSSRPYRVWGPDAGLPNIIKSLNEGGVSSFSSDHVELRRVTLLCGGDGKRWSVFDTGYAWKVAQGASIRGSSLSGKSGLAAEKVGEVMVTVPDGTARLDLQLGVANGPWKEICSEKLEGPILRAKSSVSYLITQNGQPSLTLKFVLPVAVRGQDYRVDAFDATGTRLAANGRSEGDNSVEINFTPRKNAKIARLRLLARPYQWGTFRNVAMQPKGGF